jgi:hypothetical protein
MGNHKELKLDRLEKISSLSSMDKTVFEMRAMSVFHNLKYVFYDEIQQGEIIKKLSVGNKAAILATGALAGFGAFMFNFASFTDDQVKPELVKIGALCDLTGIKLSAATVQLVLLVYSDNLTDEALIGKCHLIKDRLASFKQFAMRMGWRKQPVMASVFFVFNNSEKAFRFRKSVQDHCKHHGFFNTNWVLPFGIDVSARSVWDYKGLPLHRFKLTDIETKLFSECN